MNTKTSYIRFVSAAVVLLILTATTGTTASDHVDTSSTNSLSANPLSLLRSVHRDEYERRLHQIQTMQQYHQRTFRDMINALPLNMHSTINDKKENEKKRRLQNSTSVPTTMEEPFCNSDGTVNFDNNDFIPNTNLFASTDNKFDSTCDCFEENTLPDFMEKIQLLNVSDIPLFVSEVNRLLGDISIVSNYSCINSCEACFTFGNETSKTCGIVSGEELNSVQSGEGNFTFEEIFAFNDDSFAEVVDQVSLFSNNCIDYTTSPYTGKLCFTVEIMGTTIPDENSTIYCNITYDDTLCNSCIIESECVMADCTNIESAAMIDVCKDTGLVGPFQFLAIANMDIDNTTFTVGKCNVGGNDAPVRSPVRAPSANGGAPSSTSDGYLLGFSLIPFTSLTLIVIVLVTII